MALGNDWQHKMHTITITDEDLEEIKSALQSQATRYRIQARTPIHPGADTKAAIAWADRFSEKMNVLCKKLG